MRNKLGNLVSFISKGIAPKYADNSDKHVIRVLNQRCNRNSEIIIENARYNNLDKKKVPEERILKENDIVINSTGTGTAGRIAQLRKEQLDVPTTVDSHMIILRAKDIDAKFLGYSLKAKLRQLESYAEGSTGQTEINRERLLNETIIDYPDNIDEQRKLVRQIECIDELIRLNKRINDNLVQQLSVGFEKLYSDSRHTKTFCLNEILDSTLTGEWGKEKASNPFNHKSVIIRGTDFDEISNGCVGSAPTRYLKSSSFDKKFLKSNDVLVEISGGSPTQSTGRSILITNKMLEHFDVRVFGTNFTRTFRLNGPEEAIIFKSYIDFLYRKNVFFNYENGTTGIKNLDYKAVLKMVLPDVRQAPTFKQYLMLYTKYYSLVQQLGSESMRLNDAKKNLLNRYF
ncbi:restriction endonuclease subunit S [Lactobacillus delbrueckii subsp. bulgaricus]